MAAEGVAASDYQYGRANKGLIRRIPRVVVPGTVRPAALARVASGSDDTARRRCLSNQQHPCGRVLLRARLLRGPSIE
jgi:hypothetical protein